MAKEHPHTTHSRNHRIQIPQKPPSIQASIQASTTTFRTSYYQKFHHLFLESEVTFRYGDEVESGEVLGSRVTGVVDAVPFAEDGVEAEEEEDVVGDWHLGGRHGYP